MRVLIVEDEPPIARRIELLVRRQLGEELSLLHAVQTFDDAEARLAVSPVDVLLLDLNLHGRDGFALLARAVAGPFHTIVVSANTDRALEAFGHGVLDFVPKPVTAERLAQAFARVSGARAQAGFAARTLAIQKPGRVDLVAVDDVRYAKGAGAYSELFLDGGRAELHGKSLDKLLALLPPHFERVHKSYVVDMRRVTRFHAGEGNRHEVELRTGEVLPVGRERWRELKARLR